MPVYEYVCAGCGREFEHFARNMKDDEPEGCPSCGKKSITRKLSLFAARQSVKEPSAPSFGGGCGRCGDPHGPCSTG